MTIREMATNDVELVECPVCGQDAVYIVTSGDNEWFKCLFCGAHASRQIKEAL